MLKRIDIVGNPNVGVFVLATDNLAIVPYNLLDEKADIIKETLDVEVVKSSISGSSLIGSLAVANSNGIVVSPHVLDREVKQFEDMGLNVAAIPGQYTAVGNIRRKHCGCKRQGCNSFTFPEPRSNRSA